MMTNGNTAIGPDFSLAERSAGDAERRRTAVRTWIGAGAAFLTITAALWYLLAPPQRAHGAVLGLAIVAAVAGVTWVHRCGNSREHRALSQEHQTLVMQHAELKQDFDGLRRAFDKAAEDHHRQMTKFAAAVDRRLADLFGKIDAQQRDHATKAVGQAKTALADVIATMRIQDQQDARERQYELDSPTPAHGLSLAWDANTAREN